MKKGLLGSTEYGDCLLCTFTAICQKLQDRAGSRKSFWAKNAQITNHYHRTSCHLNSGIMNALPFSASFADLLADVIWES